MYRRLVFIYIKKLICLQLMKAPCIKQKSFQKPFDGDVWLFLVRIFSNLFFFFQKINGDAFLFLIKVCSKIDRGPWLFRRMGVLCKIKSNPFFSGVIFVKVARIFFSFLRLINGDAFLESFFYSKNRWRSHAAFNKIYSNVLFFQKSTEMPCCSLYSLMKSFLT